jgi:glutaredoxin
VELLKLYTMPYCPLCEDIRTGIEQCGFDYQEIDISENEVLLNLYKNDIPVVEFKAKKWFYRDRNEIPFQQWLKNLSH